MSERVHGKPQVDTIYTHLDAENEINSKYKTSATESLQQSKWKIKVLKSKEHSRSASGSDS